MKIKTIIIKNFRSIKSLEWRPNKERIDVLVGKNSVGKSSIIDAILCFDEKIKEINKDDKPNDLIGQETELMITLQLSQKELKELKINLSEFYSKERTLFLKLGNKNQGILNISKNFTTSNSFYYKINNNELSCYIFKDIQNITKILKHHKEFFDYNRYTIFNSTEPIQDQKVLNHDLLALKNFFNQIRKKKSGVKYQEDFIYDFGKISEIITKIETYDKRISNILPKFKKFNYNEYGQLPDRVEYNTNQIKKNIVSHIIKAMNLEFNYFIQNKGDHHIIEQRSKNRDSGLEEFLTVNWLHLKSEIEMKFHPDYMVCLINDGFPSTTISQRSLGEKWLLSFLIFIYYHSRLNENLFIVIDEPSINLHPNAQKSIISVIEKITHKFQKIRFLYTTHSPYLIPKNRLDRISRVVKKQNNGTEIIKFDYTHLLKKINRRFTKSEATKDTTKARHSQMFTTSLREGFFGDCVILCEGHTEILSLPIWADILDFNFINKNMTLIQVSKFEMIGYAEFFAVYKIPVFLIFDNDSDNEKNKKQHIEHNQWLIDFGEGSVEEYPKGHGLKYFIFSPNYEKHIKNEDSNYEDIERKISIKYGASRKKGIKARYIALEYQKLKYPPPKPILLLINTIKEFWNLVQENPNSFFPPPLFRNN